jgi:hypothetical protein
LLNKNDNGNGHHNLVETFCALDILIALSAIQKIHFNAVAVCGNRNMIDP